MTPQDFQTYLQLQHRIIAMLERIALALEQMIPPPAPPTYQFALKDYSSFDWASIGAVVAEQDSDGVSAVLWRKHIYFRRSPTNKFGAAIWFSRCLGKDDNGANVYEKLVTFKQMTPAEPLSTRVTSAQQSR